MPDPMTTPSLPPEVLARAREKVREAWGGYYNAAAASRVDTIITTVLSALGPEMVVVQRIASEAELQRIALALKRSRRHDYITQAIVARIAMIAATIPPSEV